MDLSGWIWCGSKHHQQSQIEFRVDQNAIDWARNVISPYVSGHGHLETCRKGLNADKDYNVDLYFGGYYECICAFKANATGAASAGERFWFLGWYCFPYDGVYRLFFHDGDRERIFEFVDLFPESPEKICSAFKRDPMRYFKAAVDPSDRSDALKMLGKPYDRPIAGLPSGPLTP